MVEAIRQGDIPGVQLRCRQALACSPEEAWLWLREERRLERWLAATARFATEAGVERLDLAGEDEGGRAFRERGETREIEEPRRWVLAFQRLEANWGAATDLTLELTGQARGCELSVLQFGFQRLPLSAGMTVWEGYRRRWRGALGRLAGVVGGG